MDFLQAEIERKRKQLESNEVTTNKKYFKRGDLAKQQAQQYHEKQEAKRSKTSQNDRGSKDQDDELNKLLQSNRKDTERGDGEKHLPRDDVIRRLRERGEPIRLFGESDEEAAQRLRYVEMMSKEDEKGLRNDFKAALDKLDQDYLDDLVRKTQDGPKQSRDIKVQYDGTTLEEILELSADLDNGDKKKDCAILLKFMKFLLYLWAGDLNKRSPEEKTSLSGKLASARYEQTSAYLKPLFKKLKTQSITDDILAYLVDIVGCMLEKNYVKASDSYLKMAIGNAPWPIGVTMVGIHARTGREKIFSQHVAHVLNDETQRKYIQALKRLITYCQKVFPTDPSKSLEFRGIDPTT